LCILSVGLHINLIHETARHTGPLTNAEIVNQPEREEDQKRKLASVFSKSGCFIKAMIRYV
jgi:hypothetical protein